MAEQSFSDICQASFQNDRFDCERALFSDAPSSDPPSLSSSQKPSLANVETNFSHKQNSSHNSPKSDAVIEGSFIKGLERFERELSYEESVFDIYGMKEEVCGREKKPKLRSDKELISKYVMRFEQPKSSRKSTSRSKMSGLKSIVSVKKIEPAISSTRSPPRSVYYASGKDSVPSRHTKVQTQRSPTAKLAKRESAKHLLGSKSRSKSKISVSKSKLNEREKAKSIIPFR